MKKSLLYIGNRLKHRGAGVTTIDTLGPCLEEEGFKVRYASGYKNKIFRMLDMLAHIIIYGKRVDYVLIDTYSTHNFWYAYAAAKTCRALNVKYVPLLHGGALPERLKKSPEHCKKLFARAYRNVAPSRYLYTVFESAGYTNLTYIPNSVPIKNYSFQDRMPVEPRLLWVRAFAGIYNPLLALKILQRLVKEYAGAVLCMIGADKDGSMTRCREYAKKHGLPVEFTGKLSKRAWRERAKDFDIFLNTARVDNTPVSVIEAMALGLPVVSSEVGGISFLLENQKNALLVKPEETQGFADAVKNLVDDPNLASKLAKAARTKAEGFDWENVRTYWLKLLV